MASGDNAPVGRGVSGMDLGIPGIENVVPVGQGGSAVVYRGKQVKLERTVAIKVLRESWDEAGKTRFDRERRAMGRLSEDVGIVPIYEADETANGDPYFIMPYYENGSLQGRIDTFGAVGWTEAVGLIEAVGVTISKAHSADIIHRDIKPANLLIDNGGRPLVGDFGIARIASDLTGINTQSAYFTPAFSPPELFSAGGTTHPTVDVYGLGATLWSLLAGGPPFLVPGETISSVALLSRVVNEPVGDLRATVPSEICDVVEQAMAKDPRDRPQTVDAFLFDLRRARGILDGTVPHPQQLDESAEFYSEDTAQFESIGSSIPDPILGPTSEQRAGLALKPSWAISTGGGASSAIAAIQEAERGELETTEQAGSQSSGPGRNAWLAIAASVVVLGGLITLLVNRGGDESADADSSDGAAAAEALDEEDDVGKPVESAAPEDVIFTEDVPEVVLLEQFTGLGVTSLLPDSFASAQRSVLDGTDLGSPMKVQTNVSELTSTSAVVWVHSDKCSVARFTSSSGVYGSPGWPDFNECGNTFKQTLSDLDPGRKYVFSINLYTESSKPVRAFVEFETPTGDNEPLMIEGLRIDREGPETVGISFSTTNCAVIKVERPSNIFRDDGWPTATEESCRTEHRYRGSLLSPNSIFDLQVTAFDEARQVVRIGITTATEPVAGAVPEITETRVETLSENTVEVFFETDVCASPTFVLHTGKVVFLQGCQVVHRYIVSLLEPGRDYEIQVLARNESGQTATETITFNTQP